MKHLKHIQDFLEHSYGAKTGLDVREFCKIVIDPVNLGQLVIEEAGEDLELALLLDKNLTSNWKQCRRSYSVHFEEVSHFVYLCFNHNRGRSVTKLEMEIQSEVDRVLLAYHSKLVSSEKHQIELHTELIEKPYKHSSTYEDARKIAARFIQDLSKEAPSLWKPIHFERLRRFFHSDLAEKIHLSRPSGKLAA